VRNLELNLGEPEGISLREFLQSIAMAETSRRKPQVVIPTGPIKVIVGALEAAHIPFPVSTDNIKGMERVQRMETAESLREIGLQLTPFSTAMKKAVAPENQKPPAVARPLRILLLGAGKIGIVHSLNLLKREGTTIAGIVDLNPKSFRLYRSMGITAPAFTDFDSAVKQARPDAVIVATPAITHLALAEKCMSVGLPLLVEKPMAVTLQSIEQFEKLCSRHADIPCHFGYMAAQFPHAATARQWLPAIGRITQFYAFALQSHIMGAKPVRWEMIKAQSGGGVLINFASHVLSLVFRTLGMPAQTNAHIWPVHSVEVEDAALLQMQYADFSGSMIASWSAAGYARPKNEIVIIGEKGKIVIGNFSAHLYIGGDLERSVTQCDFDLGYNAAPDYTGAGFSLEHANFARAVRETLGLENEIGYARTRDNTILSPPVEIAEAAQIERFVHGLYAEASQGRPQLPPAQNELDKQIAEAMEAIGR
jgi:predicted dehydrogenase